MKTGGQLLVQQNKVWQPDWNRKEQARSGVASSADASADQASVMAFRGNRDNNFTSHSK